MTIEVIEETAVRGKTRMIVFDIGKERIIGYDALAQRYGVSKQVISRAKRNNGTDTHFYLCGDKIYYNVMIIRKRDVPDDDHSEGNHVSDIVYERHSLCGVDIVCKKRNGVLVHTMSLDVYQSMMV